MRCHIIVFGFLCLQLVEPKVVKNAEELKKTIEKRVSIYPKVEERKMSMKKTVTGDKNRASNRIMNFPKEPEPWFIVKPGNYKTPFSYNHQALWRNWNPHSAVISSDTPINTKDMMALSRLLPFYNIYPSKILIRSNDYTPVPPAPPAMVHKVIHLYYPMSPTPTTYLKPTATPTTFLFPKPQNDYKIYNPAPSRPGKAMHTAFTPSSGVGLYNIIPYNPNPPLVYHAPTRELDSFFNSNSVESHEEPKDIFTRPSGFYEQGLPVVHPSMAPPIIHHPSHPTLAPFHLESQEVAEPVHQRHVVHYKELDRNPHEENVVHIRPSLQFYVPKEIDTEQNEVLTYEPKLGNDKQAYFAKPNFHYVQSKYQVLPLNARPEPPPTSSNNLTYPLKVTPTPYPIPDRSIRPVVEESQEEDHRRNTSLLPGESEVTATTMATTTTSSVPATTEDCQQSCVEDTGVTASEHICASNGVLYPSKTHYDCAKKCSKEDLQQQLLSKCETK